MLERPWHCRSCGTEGLDLLRRLILLMRRPRLEHHQKRVACFIGFILMFRTNT